MKREVSKRFFMTLEYLNYLFQKYRAEKNNEALCFLCNAKSYLLYAQWSIERGRI